MEIKHALDLNAIVAQTERRDAKLAFVTEDGKVYGIHAAAQEERYGYIVLLLHGTDLDPPDEPEAAETEPEG